MNRDAYASGSQPKETFRWGSIIGVLVGALVGNYFSWGIASINAMVAACLCYLIARIVTKGK